MKTLNEASVGSGENAQLIGSSPVAGTSLRSKRSVERRLPRRSEAKAGHMTVTLQASTRQASLRLLHTASYGWQASRGKIQFTSSPARSSFSRSDCDNAPAAVAGRIRGPIL
jgi:hypothetical protein